jgi:hypothetical protein
MITEPKIVGIVEIPRGLRDYNVFSNDVCLQLPEIPKNNALQLEFPDEVELFYGRKQILMAASRIYGYGKIKTGSQGNILFVWMKTPQQDLMKKMRDEFAKSRGIPNGEGK